MTNEEIKAKLQMLRSGDLGLSETFWVYFMSVAAILFVAGMALGAFGGMFMLGAGAWTIFMVMPVFKAAEKYKGNQGWVLAAKFAILIFALFAAISLVIGGLAMFGTLFTPH